ncbi:MAG: hypothetical protein ACR2OV_09350 [Hyphomicrobiaceae bacterium]
MSQTLSAGVQSGRPQSLRPASLVKRAAIGLFILVFGVVAAAWLMHSSIGANDAGVAVQSADNALATAATSTTPGKTKQ